MHRQGIADRGEGTATRRLAPLGIGFVSHRGGKGSQSIAMAMFCLTMRRQCHSKVAICFAMAMICTAGAQHCEVTQGQRIACHGMGNAVRRWARHRLGGAWHGAGTVSKCKALARDGPAAQGTALALKRCPRHSGGKARFCITRQWHCKGPLREAVRGNGAAKQRQAQATQGNAHRRQC